MPSLTRRRIWLLRVGLLAFGGLLAVIAGELLLRWLGITFPLPYAPDPITGSRMRPGWSGWFTKEGIAFASVNSAGFRDREHSVSKPAGTYRILVLGDSYSEALQVDERQAFWSVLEQSLAANFRSRGQAVEVVNMAVSGWGTAQECLALEHYGLPYAPDLVVLAFFSGNDLRNNSRRLEPEGTRPFFELRNGELSVDWSFRESATFRKALAPSTEWKVWLVNHSRLLQVIQEVRGRLRQSSTARTVGEAGLDSLCFVEPRDATERAAWEVTEKLVSRMNDTCRRHGAKFLLATVTTAIQVHPDRQVRADFSRRLGVADLGYSDRRIAALGASQGFPVVVLTDPMREAAESRGLFLHGFANTAWGVGHWNAEGHRLAGEVLAKWIERWVAEEPAP